MSTEPGPLTDSLDQQQKQPVSPRSPLYALLLSLLMSGLGHIYCGRLVPGLIWAALGALSGTLSMYSMATNSMSLASWLPMWIVSIASAAHAWWTAKHCQADYRLQPMNRWYVYLLFLAVGSFGAVGHGVLLRSNVVRAFITPSRDMKPTLQPGDRFLVDMTAYFDTQVEIGDVIVFKNPEIPRRSFVKRVRALAGDKIEVREGAVTVNGEVVIEGNPDQDVPDFGPFVVPPHNCFVLGDNLEMSKDSRLFGPVPYATIEGKATNLFWPQGSWSRLGKIR